MKLIGLAGAAGAGKDTVASMMLDNVTGFTRAFADPLRHAAAAAFGLTMQQMTDRNLKETVIERWGKSPRQILQLLGTECFRDVFGADHWVKRAEVELNQVIELDKREAFAADVCIFTDVRFAEEAEWIIANGGVVVEVYRPGTAKDDHRSAQPLPRELLLGIINNNGTLETLSQTIAEGLPVLMREAEPLHIAKRAA